MNDQDNFLIILLLYYMIKTYEGRLQELEARIQVRFNWQYRYLNLCGETFNDEDIDMILQNNLLHEEIQYLQMNTDSLQINKKSLLNLIYSLKYLGVLHISISLKKDETGKKKMDEDVIVDISAHTFISQLQIVQSPNFGINLSRMPKLKWERLYHLKLYCVSLNFKGYKNLTRAHLPNLESLEINTNQTELIHLIKGQWPLLNKIQFRPFKAIYDELPLILKGNWKNLSEIDISQGKRNLVQQLISIKKYRPDMKLQASFEKKKKAQFSSKEKKNSTQQISEHRTLQQYEGLDDFDYLFD